MACALLLIGLSGCASLEYPRPGPTCQDMQLPALPEAAPRLHFEAFSALPPQGPNWCVGDLDKKNGGVFVKNRFGGQIFTKAPSLGDRRNTLACTVGLEPVKEPIGNAEELETFVQNVLKNAMAEMPQGRILQQRITREANRTDAQCVRVEETSEGQMSQAFRAEVFVLRVKGVICKNPERPIVASIICSERYLSQYPPSSPLMRQYQNELEPFLDSLQFLP